jgi:hypothetical protein
LRHVWLLVLAMGCGPARPEVSDPNVTLALQGCPVTSKSLRGPLSEKQTSCVDRAFAANPLVAAQVLSQLEWTNDETAKLALLPIAPENWYRVAKHAGETTTAVRALALAQRTMDPAFAADVDLETVRVAGVVGDDNAANAASDRLLDRTDLEGGQRVAALRAFAQRNDRARVERVCRKTKDVKLAWACLEAAPDLPDALDAVARLPTLSFADVERLASNPALRARFPQIECATSKPRDIRWMFEKVNNPPNPPPPSGEVVLYRRLATSAKADAAACFLQASAVACLQRVHSGTDCPALSSVADYLATVEPEQRNAYIQPLLVSKTDTYRLLRDDSSPYAKAILFHLHVVLAESLIVSRSRRDVFWLPQYHVQRAWRFWPAAATPTVSFATMLSQPLVDAICRDRACVATSKDSGWNDCKTSCRLDDETWRNTCSTP